MSKQTRPIRTRHTRETRAPSPPRTRTRSQLTSMVQYRDQLGRFATPPSRRGAQGASRGRRPANRWGGGGMETAGMVDGCRRLVNRAKLNLSFTSGRFLIELHLFLAVNTFAYQTRQVEQNKAMLKLLLAYVIAVFERLDGAAIGWGLTNRSRVVRKAEQRLHGPGRSRQFTYTRSYSLPYAIQGLDPIQEFTPRSERRGRVNFARSRAFVTSAVWVLSGRGMGDPGLWNVLINPQRDPYEYREGQNEESVTYFSDWHVVWCPQGAGTSHSRRSPRSPRSPSPPSSPQQSYMRKRLRREWMDERVGLDAVLASDYKGTEDVVFLEPLEDPIRLPSGQGVNVTTMRMMLDRAPRDADGHITFTDPYREKVLSTRNAADLAQLQEWKEIADYNGPWPGQRVVGQQSAPGTSRSAPGTSGGIIPPPPRAPDPLIAPVFVFTVESLLSTLLESHGSFSGLRNLGITA